MPAPDPPPPTPPADQRPAPPGPSLRPGPKPARRGGWAALAVALLVGGAAVWGGLHWQALREAQAQREAVARAEAQQRERVQHWLQWATTGTTGTPGTPAALPQAGTPGIALATGWSPFPASGAALAELAPMLARAPTDPLLQAATAAVLGLRAEQALVAAGGEPPDAGPLKVLPLGDAPRPSAAAHPAAAPSAPTSPTSPTAPSAPTPPTAPTSPSDALLADASPAQQLERAVALGEQAWARQHAERPAWALRHLRHLRLSAWLLQRAGRLGPAIDRLERALAHLKDDGPAPLGDDPAWQAAGRAERAELELLAMRWALDAYRVKASGQHASAAEAALRRLKEAPAQWPALVAARSFDWPGEALAASPDAEIDHRLAQVHGALAAIADRQDDLVAMGREAAAAASLHQALAGAGADADRARWRRALANDRQWLALARLRQGDAASALSVSEQAWAVAASAAADPTAAGRGTLDVPRLAVTRGRALAALGRHDEALASFEWALAAWSARLARGDDPTLRLRIAQLQAWRALSLRAEGDLASAAPLLATAVAALRGLASAGDPKTVDLHRDALLALAEAAAHLAGMDPAEAPVLRPEAAAALREAAGLQRLGEDHQRLLGALGLPLPAPANPGG